MKYKVEFLVPTNDGNYRGFYVFQTNNLAIALAFAENESEEVLCQGGIFQVVYPDKTAIMQEFRCKG